uniref:Uncharacterized protein n=1 Tax=Xiphophorus couchianus TaxID=32473 RepID=A0A3B5KS39_9TELE
YSVLVMYLCYRRQTVLPSHFIFHFRSWFHRTNSGPEDGDCKEGRAAVFHEDVYGLKALLYLPHEVCWLLRNITLVKYSDELRCLLHYGVSPNYTG